MRELEALETAIGQLPEEYRRQLAPHIQRVSESCGRRQRILNLVKDTLASIRLDLKYMVFDLEATRRERDEYKAQLEKK